VLLQRSSLIPRERLYISLEVKIGEILILSLCEIRAFIGPGRPQFDVLLCSDSVAT
jgi:hypothetical protein